MEWTKNASREEENGNAKKSEDSKKKSGSSFDRSEIIDSVDSDDVAGDFVISVTMRTL